MSHVLLILVCKLYINLSWLCCEFPLCDYDRILVMHQVVLKRLNPSELGKYRWREECWVELYKEWFLWILRSAIVHGSCRRTSKIKEGKEEIDWRGEEDITNISIKIINLPLNVVQTWMGMRDIVEGMFLRIFFCWLRIYANRMLSEIAYMREGMM